MDPLFASIVLIVLGLLVVVLELFIPSAGMLGILAAVLLCSGIIVGFFHSYVTGTVMLLVIAFALPVLFALMIKVWPNTPIGRRILVVPPSQSEMMPANAYIEELKALVGRVGTAKTNMLPSGIIIIDDRQFDAVCEGFAIDPGAKVKVIALRSNRIYVQPYNPSDDLETNFGEASLLDKSLDELGIDSIDDEKS